MAFTTKRDLIEQEIEPALGEFYSDFEKADAIDDIIDEVYELTDKGYEQRDGVDFWGVVEAHDPGNGDLEQVQAQDIGPVKFDYRIELDTGDSYEEISVESFDAADILGAMQTEDLPDPNELFEAGGYDIVDTAIEMGLIGKPECYSPLGGPDYENYFEGRQAGTIQPDRDACEKNILKAEIHHAEMKIGVLRREIGTLEKNVSVYEKKLDELGGESLDEMMSSKSEEAELGCGDPSQDEISSEQERS